MPKPPIPDTFEGLPVVTSETMRQLDRAATERFGIAVLDLMENAGKAVAEETERFLRDKGTEPAKVRIAVVCGRGANGGDGLVAARRLKTAGASVEVFLCPPKKDSPYPEPVQKNLDRAREAGVPVSAPGPDLKDKLSSADLILDALLGTGSSGKPAGPIHDMIQAVTRAKKPVLSLDVPSGMNPDTGHHTGVFITAAATFTLGLPKRGLLAAPAARYIGNLKVLDIGYPKELLP